ncbi:MAG: hypothetical protein ACYSR3_13715 [Planctomycetota bacterium]|jgi:hypothetical protein
MNTKYLYRIECLAVGFICLVLFCISLFWIRFYCEAGLRIKAAEDNSVEMSPSGLLPMDIETDPNVSKFSLISARTFLDNIDTPLEWLGWMNFLQSRAMENSRRRIFGVYDWMEKIYFDKMSGHIVIEYSAAVKHADGTREFKRIRFNAGPEGVSEDNDAEVGRFYAPVLAEERDGVIAISNKGVVLYDKKLRHFFRIDLEERAVISGPELEKGDRYNPVQIGNLNKNRLLLDLWFYPPMKEVVTERQSEDSDEVQEGKSSVHFIDFSWLERATGYTLVLDESGRIDLLDMEKLELVKTVGQLPSCLNYFPSKQAVGPDDLLGYFAMPVTLKMEEPYRGLITASINREGTSMGVTVYNSEGKLIQRLDSKIGPYSEQRHPRTYRGETNRFVYFGSAWAPMLTIIKYLGENLHPPVLSMLSYFTADSFEAESGYRALFVLPNSFIAMKGRKVGEGEISKLIDAVIMILPSIILSVLLAWRVGRDAKAVGISEEGMMFWVAATVLFGLAGYITYRVVRYKERLVTCVNCGKMRRCDMEMCHRCGAGWDVPELAEPQWRVIS